MSIQIHKVGIIGAGQMGNGIAQACAISGIEVVMVDIAQAAVDKGRVAIVNVKTFWGARAAQTKFTAYMT